MRGNPIIQSILTLIMLGVIGFSGAFFIQNSVTSVAKPPQDQESQQGQTTGHHGIDIEIECHFSDPPQSYSLHRPTTKEAQQPGQGEILKAVGTGKSSVYHDTQLIGKKDNTLWLNVTWENQKPTGQYLVQLVLHIADQEPRQFTFLTHTKILNGTIQLDLSSLEHDEY